MARLLTTFIPPTGSYASGFYYPGAQGQARLPGAYREANQADCWSRPNTGTAVWSKTYQTTNRSQTGGMAKTISGKFSPAGGAFKGSPKATRERMTTLR